jgi:anti-sigma factor RsiW
MRSCTAFSEALLLDVHGELPHKDRPIWEDHLKTCPGCREEQQRLIAMLERVRETLQAPELSEGDERALQGVISNKLKRYSEDSWFKRWAASLSLPPLPALAAVSLVMLGVGWFLLKGSQGPQMNQSMAQLGTEEQEIVQQYDLLANLDLLKEMETIEKLVQVVDERNGLSGQK